MKNTTLYFVAAIGMMSMAQTIFGCPFTITNDSKTPIIVVDNYNKQAVHIPAGKSRVIDPTLHTWWKYIYNEAMDFYIEREKDSGQFYRAYQMLEKYCTDEPGANDLSLSAIKNLVSNPTDRLNVYEYKPCPAVPHEHAHATAY